MNTEYPLYGFFQTLLESGASLGIDDYELILTALQKGWGISSREELYALCKLLWLKPPFSELLFEEAFNNYFEYTDIPEEPTFVDTSLPDQSKENEISPQEAEKPRETSSTASELPPKRPRRSTHRDRQTVIREVEIAIGMNTGESLSEIDLHSGIEELDFIFYPHHLPLLPRQIRQSWRFLRELHPEGHTSKINIPQTVKEVARKGFIETPCFEPGYVNKVHLTVMIDYDGSMVPFHQEVDILVRLMRAEMGTRMETFYFYNLPSDRLLFHNPAHTDVTKLEDWSREKIRHKGKFSLLIVSDAGAARGRLQPERIRQTHTWLRQLYPLTPKIAWINPVPSWRWAGSSAVHIARIVPMYEFSEIGLQHVVNVLRGKQIQ